MLGSQEALLVADSTHKTPLANSGVLAVAVLATMVGVMMSILIWCRYQQRKRYLNYIILICLSTVYFIYLFIKLYLNTRQTIKIFSVGSYQMVQKVCAMGAARRIHEDR